MGRLTCAFFAGALVVAPLGAKAAHLVLWWDKGFYAEEDQALRETIAAFEQGTGKQVELVMYEEQELPDKLNSALEKGQPPDFAFGLDINRHMSKWAFDDRLADITEAVGHFSDLFDPDALAWFMLLNQKTGKRALYAFPMGRTTHHIHVWKSLLKQAGFTLEDVPREWDTFWSFWCDQVQPALRRATGRDDIYGIGRPVSEAGDTTFQFFQFIDAYDADYVTRDGKPVIDDPEIRRRLVKAIDSYTAVYRKGCTPPTSASWDSRGNNQAFLDQTVAMTTNNSLSIPNALKHKRPEDYYEHSATIEWPLGPDGEAFPIQSVFFAAVVFKDGRNVETAKEFVRFLVAEGWLAHYLDFAGERMLPPMPKLLDAPFWLDPSDPHRMAAAMQIASRPTQYEYTLVSGDWRYNLVWQEQVWAKAIHRVAADGISPEQAVDEAIARIKQILSECRPCTGSP
jgi:multiple sugar transport system substrate-binding protein